MAAKPSSPEISVIKSHFLELQGVIIKGNVPAGLYQHDLINEECFENATNDAKRPSVRGRETLMEVMDSIRGDPENMFKNFLDALRDVEIDDRSVSEIIRKLEGAVKNKKKSQSIPESTETAEFQKLKDQLEAFHSTQESTDDKIIREQTINISQHIIQKYIVDSLQSDIEASKVKSDMEKLHHFVVIPRELLAWANREVDKASKTLLREMKKKKRNPAKEASSSNPPLFSKDTLYHASLCCEAINDSSILPSDPLSFFKRKRPQHNLSEVSFSQSKDGTITPYLIARQKDIVYVAFQGVQAVSQWMDKISFNEGLRDQSSKIPLRFFMDELLNNRKVVLTGFSFGGMLASCVSARLWHETRADQEALAQQMICITFGQPFLQIEMVEEEISVSPLFEQSIHCIFVKEDYVPLTFHYLPSNEKLPPANMSPHTKQKAKALVAPTDTIEQTPQMPEPVGLFSSSVVKSFLQYISLLQEHIGSKAAIKSSVKEAVTWLESMLAQLRKDVPLFLYGNCYIITKEEGKGVVWQKPQTKQLAAMDLSQNSSFNFERLYSMHEMSNYIILILRSHLEMPIKFILPNQGQSINNKVVEVDSLRPSIHDTLTYYEYPEERVVVLEGNNLWFSYKVCLDEKYVFSTSPETTTQSVIKFHASVEESSELQLVEKVKVTLFSHFASSIRHTMTIKKEPQTFSVRQMQLARHTPSQVIQLAYLCALLEQREQRSESKRFTAIAEFLKEAVQVVPVESVFDAITYERHDIALLCAKALKERDPRLQPSQLMLMGALKASIRATIGHDGRVIDQFFIPTVKSFQQVFQAAQFWLGHHQPEKQAPVRGQVGAVTSKKLVSSKAHGSKSSSPMAKLHSEMKHSDLAKAHKQTKLPPKYVTVPYAFPIFFDSYVGPAPKKFPQYLIQYFYTCLKNLIENQATEMSISCGEDLKL